MLSISKKSISFELLISILSTYIFIAIVVTFFHILYIYYTAEQSIDSEIENLYYMIDGQIANSLWNLDSAGVTYAVHDLSKSHLISGVIVTNTKHEILEKNGIGNLEKEIVLPVIFLQDQTEMTIGYLKISPNYDFIWQRIEKDIYVIVLSSLIKSIALWIIFLYWGSKIIVKPLSQFRRAFFELDTAHSEKALMIINSFLKKNEFRDLAVAFNVMHEGIKASQGMLAYQTRMNKDIEFANIANATLNINLTDFIWRDFKIEVYQSLNASHIIRSSFFGYVESEKFDSLYIYVGNVFDTSILGLLLNTSINLECRAIIRTVSQTKSDISMIKILGMLNQTVCKLGQGQSKMAFKLIRLRKDRITFSYSEADNGKNSLHILNNGSVTSLSLPYCYYLGESYIKTIGQSERKITEGDQIILGTDLSQFRPDHNDQGSPYDHLYLSILHSKYLKGINQTGRIYEMV